MHVLIFALVLIRASCFDHENYYFASTIYPVGNIRRRDIVPFQISRRTGRNSNGANYRRTKDIREDGIDRRFEITEAQLREAQREIQRDANIESEAIEEARRMALFKNSFVNEISENNINSAQEDNNVRRKILARDEDLRILDRNNREYERSIYNREKMRLEQQGRLF